MWCHERSDHEMSGRCRAGSRSNGGRGVPLFLVALLLLAAAAAAEDHGSWSGDNELVTLLESNEDGSGATGEVSPEPPRADDEVGFVPALVDGGGISEDEMEIGAVVIATAVGSVCCIALCYVLVHSWKHDRFCFSYPHPDDEHDGMCAVPRDSAHAAAALCVAPDGAEEPDSESI
jgi:hypothetical protein